MRPPNPVLVFCLGWEQGGTLDCMCLFVCVDEEPKVSSSLYIVWRMQKESSSHHTAPTSWRDNYVYSPSTYLLSFAPILIILSSHDGEDERSLVGRFTGG